MKQAEIIQQLDAFFSIEAFDESAFWQSNLKDGDRQRLERFAVSSFYQGIWNGLMLNNTERVARVYTVVFPTQDVIDTIIAREVAGGAQGALIFAHHLFGYDPDGRGFHFVSEAQLEEMKEHHISFYLCHAPLDCHNEISTSTALANVLGVREQTRFSPLYGGMARVQGVMGKPITFQSFAKRLAKVTDVAYLRYDQVRQNGRTVERVAVVPGNGADPALIAEAAELGCDTYVSGQWWYPGDTEYAAQQREAMQDLLKTIDMNLLGVSRYATEMVVMRDQMPGWFGDRGLDVEFINQEDPWL